MKNFMLVFLMMLIGILAASAQAPTPTTGSPTPDKTWVLKTYPNATSNKWHREKSGQYEFEFMDGTKETKVWFNAAGAIVKTKIETDDDDRSKGTARREKTDDDDNPGRN
ncbi:MAG: hypothetical protein KA479_05345 [Saprospiraceae bacterium]|nr:hypothetical protein [Saprospiraceae bacterium]